MKTLACFLLTCLMLTVTIGCAPRFTAPPNTPTQPISFDEFRAVDSLLKKLHYRQALARAQVALAQSPNDQTMQAKAELAREGVARLDTGPASRDALMDRMSIEEDAIDGIRWYRHRYAQQRRGTHMNLYIGQRIDQPGTVWMRLAPIYESGGWLFPEGFAVVAGKQRFEWSGHRFKRDHSTIGTTSFTGVKTTTREWVDLPVGDKERRMIEMVIASSDATLRFRGERGVQDYAFSEMDRLIYQDLLTAFDTLNSP